jgi:hypothetical protein
MTFFELSNYLYTVYYCIDLDFCTVPESILFLFRYTTVRWGGGYFFPFFYHASIFKLKAKVSAEPVESRKVWFGKSGI